MLRTTRRRVTVEPSSEFGVKNTRRPALVRRWQSESSREVRVPPKAERIRDKDSSVTDVQERLRCEIGGFASAIILTTESQTFVELERSRLRRMEC